MKCNREVTRLPVFVGFVRESRAERRTLPEDGTSVFQAAEAATFGTGSEEG